MDDVDRCDLREVCDLCTVGDEVGRGLAVAREELGCGELAGVLVGLGAGGCVAELVAARSAYTCEVDPSEASRNAAPVPTTWGATSPPVEAAVLCACSAARTAAAELAVSPTGVIVATRPVVVPKPIEVPSPPDCQSTGNPAVRPEARSTTVDPYTPHDPDGASVIAAGTVRETGTAAEVHTGAQDPSVNPRSTTCCPAPCAVAYTATSTRVVHPATPENTVPAGAASRPAAPATRAEVTVHTRPAPSTATTAADVVGAYATAPAGTTRETTPAVVSTPTCWPCSPTSTPVAVTWMPEEPAGNPAETTGAPVEGAHPYNRSEVAATTTGRPPSMVTDGPVCTAPSTFADHTGTPSRARTARTDDPPTTNTRAPSEATEDPDPAPVTEVAVDQPACADQPTGATTGSCVGVGAGGADTLDIPAAARSTPTRCTATPNNPTTSNNPAHTATTHGHRPRPRRVPAALTAACARPAGTSMTSPSAVTTRSKTAPSTPVPRARTARVLPSRRAATPAAAAITSARTSSSSSPAATRSPSTKPSKPSAHGRSSSRTHGNTGTNAGSSCAPSLVLVVIWPLPLD